MKVALIVVASVTVKLYLKPPPVRLTRAASPALIVVLLTWSVSSSYLAAGYTSTYILVFTATAVPLSTAVPFSL